MRFEWDPAKDRANQAKHGISFDAAQTLFTSGVDYLEIYDIEHSTDEDRFFAIGPIASGVICVVFTERDDRIRLIGARPATRREQQLFLQFIAEAES